MKQHAGRNAARSHRVYSEEMNLSKFQALPVRPRQPGQSRIDFAMMKMTLYKCGLGLAMAVLATNNTWAQSDSPASTPTQTAPEQNRWFDRYADPYRPRHTPPVSFTDSSRLDSLIRAGNLYLSLRDAIALALENNLDVELQRFGRPIAATDTLRARGGGTLRGVGLTVSELASGIGGPGAPLLNVAANGSVSGNSSILTSVSDTLPITGGTTNLSIANGTLSTGTLPPPFDPALVGNLNWQHQSTPQPNAFITGTPATIGRTATGGIGLDEGFSPGTQFRVNLNGANQTTNSSRLTYNPYTTSNLGVNLVQPLLRGFGIRVNRRFIRMAENQEKLSDLVFRQQVISTVSGVVRLYYDLVSLNEDRRVRRETLSLAEQFLENNRQQVQQGTLAPLEITRAQAFVAASRQDLANAEGFVAQQELILKAVLSHRGTASPQLANVSIIPTDPITIPDQEPIAPIQDLVSEAYLNRPDLQAARLQLTNSQISLEGSRNALLPQIDLVASFTVAGLAGQRNSLVTNSLTPGTGTTVTPTIDTSTIGGFWTTLGQVFQSNYPTYGAGIQITLPLKNRVAQADFARDEIQVRQSEVRQRQLENQVRLEIDNALVTLHRARAALEAAIQSRMLQQQSLEMEQQRYAVGLSTTFLVTQYQSYTAQARSTEVAARSTYIKAQNALQRAVGSTLATYNVSVDEAYRGQINRAPDPIPVVTIEGR